MSFAKDGTVTINIKAPVAAERVAATHCKAAGAAQRQNTACQSTVKGQVGSEDTKEVWSRIKAWFTSTSLIIHQTTVKDGP